MPIIDSSYQHWDGKLEKRLFRWWPMLRYHLRLLLQRKLVWLLLFLSFLPALVCSVVIYVASPEGAAQQGVDFLYAQLTSAVTENVEDAATIDALSEADLYRRIAEVGLFVFLLRYQAFIVLMTVSTVGAGLVARDIRSNALEIYLTKPLRADDYVLGKLMVIAVFVFLVTFAPSALLFAVAGVLWPGFLSAAYSVLFPLVGCCILAAFVNGMVMLSLSSLSRSSRYASAFWFAACMLSAAAGAMLHFQTGNPFFHLLSYRENFAHIFAGFFGSAVHESAYPAAADVSVLIPILVLTGVVTAAALVLGRNITRGVGGAGGGH